MLRLPWYEYIICYGTLAFPYLSFQELLTYSVVPLFGFAIFSLTGMLFGVINNIANRCQERKKWPFILENFILISICALIIYQDLPERWVIVPMVTFILVIPHILNTSALESARQTNPHLLLSVLLIVFLSLGSFGYGRTQAEHLIRKTEPNTQLTLESGTESGRLIGKLGAYYFFLSTSSRVNVLSEQSIKRIEYLKKLKAS